MRQRIAAVFVILGGLMMIAGGMGPELKWPDMNPAHIFRPVILVDTGAEEEFAADLMSGHTDEVKTIGHEMADVMVKAADKADETPRAEPQEALKYFIETGKADLGDVRWQTFVPITSELNDRLGELSQAGKLPDCANVSELFRAWAKGLQK